MNTVTLNGVSSSTITGLLIQSLPSISKPMIRTSIEEIDGRDGDIVTKLGYSAYDKEFDIGLHGNYDVNEVISFFDSEGEVIFSNEPDKYYRYQILADIDFKRLLRFKEAEVTMHVQPFKYSATEADIDEAVTAQTSVTVTNSGNTIARPVITMTGSGDVVLSLNGAQILSINFDTYSTITIDAEALEALSGSLLANRYVTGDYDDLQLEVGENEIGWDGTLTHIQVSRYSRWI